MEYLDHVHLAAVKAVNEAVVNALVAVEDVATFKPPKGHLCRRSIRWNLAYSCLMPNCLAMVSFYKRR